MSGWRQGCREREMLTRKEAMGHPTKNQKGLQERNDVSNPEHRDLQKLLERGMWKRVRTGVDISVSKLTAGSSEACKGAESLSTTWHPRCRTKKEGQFVLFCPGNPSLHLSIHPRWDFRSHPRGWDCWLPLSQRTHPIFLEATLWKTHTILKFLLFWTKSF